MKKYKNYLFDADGTLFDSTELIYLCFNHTAKKMGHDPIPRDEVMKHIGVTLRDQMNIYFGQLENSLFEKYKTVHMDYQLSIYKDFIKPCPGVKETLEYLRSQKSHCVVVTSRMRNTLDLYLQELMLFEYFKFFVTPESTTLHKPNPEPAKKALELLGCEASDAVFIGDAVFDVECGNRAGIDTIFVEWSHTPVNDLPIKPTFTIKDMREICIQ